MKKIKKIFKKFIHWLNFRRKVLILQLKYFFRRGRNPVFNRGIHFLEGASGTGKTMLANYILQTTSTKDNFFYSNIDQFDNNKTVTVNFFDLFEAGKQVKRLPRHHHGRYCWGLFIDELNANFNRRLNNRRDYNDKFIGLMQFSVTHRHQGIPRIYYLGQSLQLQDRQVMQIFKYRHIVSSSRRRYSYPKYKDDGTIVRLPKKLRVEHYIKSELTDTSGNPVFVKFKTSRIKIDYNKHVKTYNHLGYANQFNNLPTIDT